MTTLLTGSAHLPPWLQTEYPEGAGHHHPLLLVVRRGDPLKDLQALQCLSATLGLVGYHAADRPQEDLAGGPKVKGSTRRLYVAALAKKLEVLHCETESTERKVGGYVG